jgi:diguanylate cyclase (GGDEF)-like protein
MPQPGDRTSQLQPQSEESLLDLLVEAVDGLEDPARGAFLRQFLRTVSQVDLSEAQSNECWRAILQRRREFAAAGKSLSFRATLVDVMASLNLLRVPVLMEYEELRKLRINAATDALTGLYNRRLFDEYCEKELNRANRYGHQLAVVILDVRKLKEVNDRHGHLRGDEILQLATTTLRRRLRASDFAFRIGGDELALLLPQTDPEQANILCRRVRSQYESESESLKLEIGVTLDFGVAVYPQDGDDKDKLMAVADHRLYELKEERRENDQPRPAEPIRLDPPARPARETASPQPPPERPGAPTRPAHTARPEQRKWERVPLAGTKAYAVLSESNRRTARVLDLSYGGVALLLDITNDVPSQFSAVLHVPILPPVRVVLRRAYTTPVDGGRMRVGCSFVS